MLANVFLKIQTKSRIPPNSTRYIHLAPVLERARRGTKQRKDALKKARKRSLLSQVGQEVKKEFVSPKQKLALLNAKRFLKGPDDGHKGYPVDDVYYQPDYRSPIYTVQEAVQLHRESQHPAQYNNPNAELIAQIHLDMKTEKKNKYVGPFSNIVLLPHIQRMMHTRKVLAICKDQPMIEQMEKMGVEMAMGPEAIKLASKGSIDLHGYTHVVCHSSLLPDMISIRGMLKKKFPSVAAGTAGIDLEPIVKRFLYGIKYEVTTIPSQPEYGKIDIKLGKLQTDAGHVEDSLRVLVKDIELNKPKSKSHKIIASIYLACEKSKECLQLDHSQFFETSQEEEQSDDDSDDEIEGLVAVERDA